MNETLRKFGHPETLVRAYPRWVVVLRPRQVTLGSLVLVCTEPVRSLARASFEAFGELKQITEDVERVLHGAFGYDRINYLMLMMVDPDVHFHVIPRYATERAFEGATFRDESWPGPPDLRTGMEPDARLRGVLLERLRAGW